MFCFFIAETSIDVNNAGGERVADATSVNNITISSFTEYKDYTFNEKHDICTLVTLKAPFQEEDENVRAPIDVVAVIDKSGSMSGQKLRLVKKTLDFLLTQCMYIHIFFIKTIPC